jgi:hypothetical protein
MMRQGRRRQARIHARRTLLILSALVTAATLTPTAANAAADTTIIRNWETGLCLDSNAAGNVYTGPCNGGPYQSWKMTILLVAPNSSDDVTAVLTNVATGRCLDSNFGGSIYTSPCQLPNDWQHWLWWGDGNVTQFADHHTRLFLDSNRAGNAYTLASNLGGYQNWRRGF